MLASHIIDVQVARLAYRRVGDGPPLVLLHGGMEDGRSWARQLDGHSGDFTVFAWDAPGRGQSSYIPDPLDSSCFTLMTPPSRSRAQHLLDLAIPFLGVGAGAVTVVLFHHPMALIPRPPFWPWLFAAGALAALAMLLALGLEDGWEEDDEVDPAERWRAAVLAYVAGVVASVTFVVSVALIDRLEASV